jgi:Na+/melibiose symporter-like transporter
VVIPAETVRHLGLVYGPGAAIVTLISVLVVLRYKLNQHSHAEILKVLTARRQMDQPPAAVL